MNRMNRGPPHAAHWGLEADWSGAKPWTVPSHFWFAPVNPRAAGAKWLLLGSMTAAAEVSTCYFFNANIAAFS